MTSAFVAALLAAAAGYGFALFSFRGREPLFWIVLGTVMVPTQALATPTYLLFAKVGLTNNPRLDHPAVGREPVRRLSSCACTPSARSPSS